MAARPASDVPVAGSRPAAAAAAALSAPAPQKDHEAAAGRQTTTAAAKGKQPLGFLKRIFQRQKKPASDAPAASVPADNPANRSSAMSVGSSPSGGVSMPRGRVPSPPPTGCNNYRIVLTSGAEQADEAVVDVSIVLVGSKGCTREVLLAAHTVHVSKEESKVSGCNGLPEIPPL